MKLVNTQIYTTMEILEDNKTVRTTHCLFNNDNEIWDLVDGMLKDFNLEYKVLEYKVINNLSDLFSIKEELNDDLYFNEVLAYMVLPKSVFKRCKKIHQIERELKKRGFI